MESLPPAALFAQLDTDNSNTLDEDEMSAGGITHGIINRALRSSGDNNGTIDSEEFSKLIELNLIKQEGQDQIDLTEAGLAFGYVARAQADSGMTFDQLLGRSEKDLITKNDSGGYTATDLGLVIGEAGSFGAARNQGYIDYTNPGWELTEAGISHAAELRDPETDPDPTTDHTQIATNLGWLDQSGDVTDAGDKAIADGLMEVNDADGTVTLTPEGLVFEYVERTRDVGSDYDVVLDEAVSLELLTQNAAGGYSATTLGVVIGGTGSFEAAQNQGYVEFTNPGWEVTPAGEAYAQSLLNPESGSDPENNADLQTQIDGAAGLYKEGMTSAERAAYDAQIKETYPDLYEAVTTDLGYASFVDFMDVAHLDSSVVSGEVTLAEKAADMLGAATSEGAETRTVNSDTGTFVDASGGPAFIENEDATYVKLVIGKDDSGEDMVVIFEGEQAGRAANAFMGTYNNSETFREATQAIVSTHDGSFGFHLVDMTNHGTPEGTVGYNYTDPISGESSIYLNANLTRGNDEYGSLRLTIIHEMGHSLEEGTAAAEEFGSNTGDAHGRPLSAFTGTVINEMENNGIPTGNDVDSDDYSSNLSIFDTDYYDPAVDTSAPLVPENAAEFQQYQAIYAAIKDAIAAGDYDKAQQLFASIDEDATITLVQEDPQHPGETHSTTYNVRELMVQELLLAADSNSYFDTNIDNTELNTNVGTFLNQLITNNVVSEEFVVAQADAIGMDLSHDLPVIGIIRPHDTQSGSGVNATAGSDGMLNLEEFKNTAYATALNADEAAVQALFDSIDTDGNDLIDGSELLTYNNQPVAQPDTQPDVLDKEYFIDMLTDNGMDEAAAQAFVDDLFAVEDSDGSGDLSVEEWGNLEIVLNGGGKDAVYSAEELDALSIDLGGKSGQEVINEINPGGETITMEQLYDYRANLT
jgi:Ca2+-binding EF-hand superfamily protein